MNDVYIRLTLDGKVYVRGTIDPRDPLMIGHYLRVLADRLDEIPEGTTDVTYIEDLLAESRPAVLDPAWKVETIEAGEES